MLYNESVEYLNKVIDKWDSFCKSHRLIFESIKTVLEHNKASQEQIYRIYNILEEKNKEVETLRVQNNMLFIAGCENSSKESETILTLLKQNKELQEALDKKNRETCEKDCEKEDSSDEL